MGKAARVAEKNSKEMKQAFAKAGKAVAAIATGASVAGAGIANFVSTQVRAIDAMAKGAKAAGVSAEALQELQFAAERSGASARQMEEGLRRMTRRIGLAADGAGPAAKTLDQLGISVRDIDGNVRSTEAVLQDFIRATEDMGSQAEIAAAASAVFGDDAGPKLALLLAEGEAGVRGLREEARELGIVTDEQAAKAEELADAFTNAERQFQAVAQQLAVDLMPAVLEITQALQALAPVITDLIDKVKGFGEAFAEALHGSADPAERLRSEIELTEKRISSLKTQLREYIRELESQSTITVEDIEHKEKLIEQIAELEEKQDDLVESLESWNETAEEAAKKTGEQAGATDDLTRSVDRAAPSIDDLNAKLRQWKDLVNQGGNGSGMVGALGLIAQRAYDASEAVRDHQLAVVEAEGIWQEAIAGLMNDTESSGEAFEDWAGVASDAFNLVGGKAGELGQKLVSLVSTFKEFQGATGLDAFAGGLQTAATASSIIGEGSEDGAAIGAAIGTAIGAYFGAADAGAQVGAALGALVDGNDNPESQIQFGTSGPTASTDAFRNTQLGSFNVRSGVDGFMRQLQQPVVQAIGRLFSAFENILTPDQLEQAGGTLSGLTISVDEQSFNSGAVLEQIFDRVIQVTDPFVQRLVQPFEGIENKIDALNAAQNLFATLNADPLNEFNEALENASLGVVSNIQRLGQAAQDVATDFNGSIHSMEMMTTSLQTLNQAYSQALASIEAARQNITSITGQTVDNLRFAALGDNQQAQFDFLQARANQLAAEIQTATDPEQIQRLVQQINALTQQAVQIGGQVEGRDVDFEGTIGFLEDVDAAAQERLDLLEDRMTSVYDQAIADIKDTLGVNAEAMNGAVTQIGNSAVIIGGGGRDIRDAAVQFKSGVNQLVTTPLQVSFANSAINA